MRQPRIALAAVLTLAVVPTAWGQPQAELVLHFVEIGQSDCTLIECPNGGFVLVDAGSNLLVVWTQDAEPTRLRAVSIPFVKISSTVRTRRKDY